MGRRGESEKTHTHHYLEPSDTAAKSSHLAARCGRRGFTAREVPDHSARTSVSSLKPGPSSPTCSVPIVGIRVVGSGPIPTGQAAQVKSEGTDAC